MQSLAKILSLVLLSSSLNAAQTDTDAEKIHINDRWDSDAPAVERILKINTSRFEGINAISLSNSIEINYSEDFLKLNPRKEIVQVDKKTELFTYTGNDNCFYRFVKGKLKDGTISPPVKEAYNGESIQTLEMSSDPTMIINKNNWRISHGAMTGKNPLLEMYSFLNDDTDPNVISNILIADIKSQVKWQSFRDKVVGVKKTTLGDKPTTVIKSGVPGKTVELVYFDEETCLPVIFVRYDANGKLARRYSVTSFLSTPQGKTVGCPLHSEVEFYLNGWKIVTNKIVNQKFELNPSTIENTNFELDPAEASSLWDSDNKKRIEVPR